MTDHSSTTRRKFVVLTPLMCLAFLAAAISPVLATDVFIVAGQSNGWRISSIDQGPKDGPDAKSSHKVFYCSMYCTSRPTESTLRELTSIHPGTYGYELVRGLRERSGGDIVVVQYCVCGASLHGVQDWYPGDDPANGKVNDQGLYAKFQQNLAQARKDVEQRGLKWEAKGLIWHQGESDAVPQHAKDYEQNLTRLFARFRADLGPDLPIVTGHIRDIKPDSSTVNSAIDKVAANGKRITVVKTTDLESEAPNDWHFTRTGCHKFGQRILDAMKR